MTAGEHPAYLRTQLLTYLGNKRALLGNIDSAARAVRDRLGRKPRVVDAFSGSGAVSRALKRHAAELVANDIEDYARVVSECYLSNAADVDVAEVVAAVDHLNDIADTTPTPGFIRELYSPRDDTAIRPGERVFYTATNAARLDTYASLIGAQPAHLRPLLLGPLLSAASVHTNTAGVFKGFYKDRITGVGQFGGSGGDALARIKGEIRLTPPVLSAYEVPYRVLQQDANTLPEVLPEFDLAYLDPPYNQHPYGSNYFMLNLLVDYRRPAEISEISGIPTTWRRSRYNSRRQAPDLLTDLATRLPCRFLLISFNDDGFIPPTRMHDILRPLGRITEYTTEYATFRGSRNLRSRGLRVTEHLYLVDRE